MSSKGVNRKHILVIAPADNILLLRPVLEPLGHIRLDAKMFALSPPDLQTRVKLQHWCLFQRTCGGRRWVWGGIKGLRLIVPI